jgi:hypothetical protein
MGSERNNGTDADMGKHLDDLFVAEALYDGFDDELLVIVVPRHGNLTRLNVGTA